jgi:hypothetical protein
MFVGKIDVRQRQKILVTVRSIKGTKTVDVRVHETSENGEFVPTPAGVSLLPEQVEQAIELLKEAKRRIDEQP